MLTGKGIDPDTGLPDLSLLGDDHYWEVVPNFEKYDGVPSSYTLRLMRKIVKRSAGVFRKEKTETVLVDSILISRKKSFDELTPKVVDKLSKLIESYRMDTETSPARLYNNSTTKYLLEKTFLLSNKIFEEDIIEFNLSDDLIQLRALDLFNRVLRDKNKSLEESIRTMKNDKYVGVYPPNKLGGKDD